MDLQVADAAIPAIKCPPVCGMGGVSRLIGDLRRFRQVLEQRGCELGRNLGYEETDGAHHNEAAWAERLPRVLRFLLAPAGTDA